MCALGVWASEGPLRVEEPVHPLAASRLEAALPSASGVAEV